MSKLAREDEAPIAHPAAPEGGLAWDSLFLWLLSWVALLLGAEWLEADARPLQDEAPPLESQRWRGRLTLPDGQPAANVALSGWPAPTEPLAPEQRRHGHSPVYVVTDAEGRFSFEPRIDVRHRFEPQQLELGDLRDANGAEPRWSGDGEITWTYSPFPEFWFTVCDEDRARLERFTFDMVQGEQRLHGFADFSWTFARPMRARSQPQSELGRPGLHRLCVRASGCVPRSVPVLEAPREAPLEVRLRPAGACEGRLLDAAGNPLPDQRLRLTVAKASKTWRVPAYHPCAPGGVDEGNRALYEMTFDWKTDAAGRFAWDQLDPALEYELRLSDPAKTLLARIPRTDGGETRPLGDLRLAPPPGVPEGPL
jgi:hypothetical protein